VVAAFVPPPRTIVVTARLAPQRRHGDAIAPRPAGLAAVVVAVVVAPPRQLVVIARTARQRRYGDALAPRPAALAATTTAPAIIVTGSFNTHATGQVMNTAAQQAYAGHASGNPDSNPSEGRFNTT
jgi:hypothetical protein